MEVFQDDDSRYLHWLAHHPRDFVINAQRPPRPNYLMLHRATCRTISGRPARGSTWTEGQFLKACGRREELTDWARTTGGGDPRPCGLCM